MAQFGAFCPHRESFVPLWSAQHRAGRILYRSHHQEAKQGEFCTEREAEIERATTVLRRDRCEAEGTGGTGGPGRGAGGRLTGPAWVGGASARQISHIISHGHFSRPPENVAIPTMQIQYLNKLQGNYVRNCSDGSKACSARIRMQFDWTNLQQTQKTLQFQRCKFNV